MSLKRNLKVAIMYFVACLLTLGTEAFSSQLVHLPLQSRPRRCLRAMARAPRFARTCARLNQRASGEPVGVFGSLIDGRTAIERLQ